MASDDSKFSHITVHADDDDEFVIQAGIPAHASVEPAVEPEHAAPTVAESELNEASVETPAVEQEVTPDEATEQDEQKKARSKEYRATTAEDLEATPMSGMQKAIIAIALLCVFGSVAYYMFFMR